MALPPTRNEIAGTPTNAEAKAGFGKLWDYVTGLLGASGNPAQAHAALFPEGNAISFTQAMTLDASGNLLVGKTTSDWGTAGISLASQSIGLTNNLTSDAMFIRKSSTTGDAISFWYTDSTKVGAISISTTSTTYSTSSDYRLKENIVPMTGALEKVAQLKPCTYTWKADGSDGQGFIAHELQAVVPNAVVGAKDAVDADGNPKYQGIDTSFLVATLTAAIQEQQAIITQLQADVAALKAA